MSLASKFSKASDILRMMWAVGANTGVVPSGHRCMVTIELTSVCNLACPLCPTGTGILSREHKFIPLPMLERIVELTSPFAEGFVLNMFGEPTLHPDFAEAMRMTCHRPAWLSTNLNHGEERARELARWDHLRVVCSVDTVKPEEYSVYRIGGDWDRMVRNLDILAKGRCRVHPQFLVEPGHVDEAPYVAFAEAHGIPAEDVIIKVKLDEFSLAPTDKPRPGVCHSGYTEVYFDCDGYLLPCCAHVREDLHIMHVDDIKGPEDIFRGARARSIRKALGRDKNQFVSCGRCEGLNYWHKYLPMHWEAVRRSLFRRKRENGPHRLSFFE